jgi:hypothetical protein
MSTCLRCETNFTRHEEHFVEEAASFNDGCTFANNRCRASGIWWWDRDRADGNPHGHEFPDRWIRRGQPESAPEMRGASV